MTGTSVIRHELRKARDIADAARSTAGTLRLGEQTSSEAAYTAALDGAIAACDAAATCFDTAIRISEQSDARSGPVGSHVDFSTPTQAALDRAGQPSAL